MAIFQAFPLLRLTNSRPQDRMKTFFNKPSSKDLLHIPQNLTFGTSPQAICGLRFLVCWAWWSGTSKLGSFRGTYDVNHLRIPEYPMNSGIFWPFPWKQDHSFSSFCSCWLAKNREGGFLLRSQKPLIKGAVRKPKRPTDNCSILLIGLVCLKFPA